MVKKLLALALTLAIMLVSTVTAFAAEAPQDHEGLWFDEDRGYYYYYENGEKVTDAYRTVDGNLYYFDWYGDSETGGFVDCNGEAHFATEDHVVVTGTDLGLSGGKGWYYFDNNDEWYYFFADGTIACEEFVDVGSKTYYFDDCGELEIGLFDVKEYIDDNYSQIFYVTDADGAIIKTPGWYKNIEKYEYNTWHYVKDSTGVLLDGPQTIGGKNYYFMYGTMIEGTVDVYDDEIDGYVLLLAKQGGELTNKPGWYEISHEYYDGETYSEWYYIQSNGEVARDDFYIISGKTYHFDYWGSLSTGTFTVDGRYDEELETWVYDHYAADYNGVVATTPGWNYFKQYKDYSPDYFYVLEDGTVAYNCILTIDGYDYYFDDWGCLRIGHVWDDELGDYIKTDDTGKIMNKPEKWYKLDGDWYYLKEDGTFPYDEFLEVDGKTYLFDYDGRMVVGRYTIDDVTYYTDKSGMLYKDKWIKEYFDYNYVKSDGTLAREEWINNTYWFDYDGVMAVGTAYTADYGYCVFDSNGKYINRAGKVKGWQWLDGYWYYFDAINEPHDGWLKSGGNYYYFDNGQMRTDDSVWDSEKDIYYYVDKTGKMKTNGWIQDSYYGDWYYADASGALATGWTKIGGKWYYFYDYSGMCNSEIVFLYDEGKWHKFNSSGAWIGELADNTWVKDSNGDWYYITDGETLYGEHTIKGKTYYFSYNRMVANDSYSGYWLDANGKIDKGSGWRQSRYGEWYYLENGELAYGLKKIGGKWYCFDDCMIVGYTEYWDNEKGEYDYGFFGSDGAWKKIGTGWYSVEYKYNDYSYTAWYYFKNGKPLENTNDYRDYHTIGGKKYMLYYDGEMFTGAYRANNNNRYIFDKNGQLSKGGWVYVDDAWYYTDSTGRAYVGEHKIGGKTYYFNYRGIML
ncbi:MAG: hypothetical protein Q4B40_05550 [Clostridia bacterium]|nr:hypothetical protein [Clostridia bacterium]